MNINDKIKQIIIDKNLTPSYFADEIGVQRPSISHILSGRNRPSFDIIQKIIRRFPDLGYDWIMEDEPQPTNSLDFRNRTVNRPGNQEQPGYSPSGSTRENRTEPSSALNRRPATEATPAEADESTQRIDRIVVFYTDGTFREYFPQP